MNMKIKGWKEFNESEASGAGWVSDEEMKKLDPDLHDEIVDHIDTNLISWMPGLENASCEAESDALQYFGETQMLDSRWRVYPDGTMNLVMRSGGEREDFDFDWEDEDGKERTSNFLDALEGSIGLKFDEGANNGDNELPEELGERVRALLRPGFLKARRSGLL
jgi:hypothetical protein